jgi:hypothetical protein
MLLAYLDWVMRFRGFNELYEVVRRCAVRQTVKQRLKSADLCRALDLASVFYLKRVLCLQRSAATTILLRRYGFHAEMVIGAQILPFKSHAWVEIDFTVVNDKPYMAEIYQVLDRC